MSSPVVTLFDDVGDAHLYKKVSARLPAFLAEYPPKEGYRIETEVTDSLSLQKGRLALLREAIAGGKPPTDLGLPGLEEATVMVCIRRLKSPEGHTIAEGSAAKAIVRYKDYEILETAALQRLMALLGFGGEVFDQDEASDFADQGLNPRAAGGNGPTRTAKAVASADREAAPDVTPEAADDRHELRELTRVEIEAPIARKAGDQHAERTPHVDRERGCTRHRHHGSHVRHRRLLHDLEADASTHDQDVGLIEHVPSQE